MWQKNIFKTLFALLFFLFPLGQFFKLDVLVLIILLVWLFFTKNKSKNPLTKPFLIFFLIALASLLLRFPQLEINQFIISSLYLIRLVIYSSLYFIIYDLLKKKIIDKNFVLNGLIFSGVTLSIIGLLQYLIFPDMRMMKYLGWDDHYFRIVSTFLDPNFSGIIYAVTSMVLIKNLICHCDPEALRGRSNPGRTTIALFFLPFIALLLTYSRAAYLSFFTGLSVLLIQKKQLKLIPVSLIIILLLIYLLPKSSGGEGVKLERTSSINNRLDSIKTGFKVFLNNPVLGVGFNTYKFLPGKNIESHSASGVENSYVLILATTGILGFLAFLNILVRIPPQPEIIAIFISALFINSLFYPWIMIWLFLLTAVFKENT